MSGVDAGSDGAVVARLSLSRRLTPIQNGMARRECLARRVEHGAASAVARDGSSRAPCFRASPRQPRRRFIQLSNACESIKHIDLKGLPSYWQ